MILCDQLFLRSVQKGQSIAFTLVPMERGVCSDGHVSSTEIIVNGSNHANHIEVSILVALLLRDLASLLERRQELGPFAPKLVGTR